MTHKKVTFFSQVTNGSVNRVASNGILCKESRALPAVAVSVFSYSYKSFIQGKTGRRVELESCYLRKQLLVLRVAGEYQIEFLLVKLQGTPVGISGAQLYVPITNADGEGIEKVSDAIKLKL